MSEEERNESADLSAANLEEVPLAAHPSAQSIVTDTEEESKVPASPVLVSDPSQQEEEEKGQPPQEQNSDNAEQEDYDEEESDDSLYTKELELQEG